MYVAYYDMIQWSCLLFYLNGSLTLAIYSRRLSELTYNEHHHKSVANLQLYSLPLSPVSPEQTQAPPLHISTCFYRFAHLRTLYSIIKIRTLYIC